jgi:hypothetical protein
VEVKRDVIREAGLTRFDLKTKAVTPMVSHKGGDGAKA